MRKQKVLVVFLCGLVLLTGMWRNEKVQEASAQAEKAGTIALTFDDGPHCTYTKELLDGLRAVSYTHLVSFLLCCFWPARRFW